MKTIYPYKNLSLDNIPNEKWKDIPNYDGIYLISNMGRIKIYPREKRGRNCTYMTREKIKIQDVARIENPNNGKIYKQLRTKLTDENGVSASYMVSNIVGLIFLNKEPKEKEEYAHINKKWWDNKADNLEVISIRDSRKKEQELGLREKYAGVREQNEDGGYSYLKPVNYYRNKKTGKIYTREMIMLDFEFIGKAVTPPSQ